MFLSLLLMRHCISAIQKYRVYISVRSYTSFFFFLLLVKLLTLTASKPGLSTAIECNYASNVRCYHSSVQSLDRMGRCVSVGEGGHE